MNFSFLFGNTNNISGLQAVGIIHAEENQKTKHDTIEN